MEKQQKTIENINILRISIHLSLLQNDWYSYDKTIDIKYRPKIKNRHQSVKELTQLAQLLRVRKVDVHINLTIILNFKTFGELS